MYIYISIGSTVAAGPKQLRLISEYKHDIHPIYNSIYYIHKTNSSKYKL